MELRLSIVALEDTDVARGRAFHERPCRPAFSAGEDGIIVFRLGGIALAFYGRGAPTKATAAEM